MVWEGVDNKKEYLGVGRGGFQKLAGVHARGIGLF
jgi:hypothetical protein